MTDQKYDVRSKYVDETFRRWFIFGQNLDGSIVDVSDGDLDVLKVFLVKPQKNSLRQKTASLMKWNVC
jgi:hypothetical protein